MTQPHIDPWQSSEEAAGKDPVTGEFMEASTLPPMNWEVRATPSGRTPDSQSSEEQIPQHIGRYRVVKLLGIGGFGAVYLAHDDELKRQVAVKVPHRHRIAKPKHAEAYLAEARVLASLDHPHIVPVHDVGRTEDGLCFMVTRFIEGTDLAHQTSDARLPVAQAIELVATVAEALHHAHKRGLVHRDVKPANILIDRSGTAYLVDFGLALNEEDYGRGGGILGTPGYMSPEQANGEGHRVDGRSDIFSVGVVLYELLIGRRPFLGDSVQVIMQIVTDEPRPPRQIDDTIPRELERICLKALSKRASDRYTTAKDMADDLRHFLAEQTVQQEARGNGQGVRGEAQGRSEQDKWILLPRLSSLGAPSPTTPNSEHQLIKIVPKGLRSFDEHDAEFFLELLSGPRDREGLPDSIRFWKTRIEEKDTDKTFSVGLIYGPSGCGKSSLVKAGLIPRLSDEVIVVYVEASAEDTETRLLKSLGKRCVGLSGNLTLKTTLTAFRRGHGIPAGKKVLIVLDQFEQWLHAKKEEENTELVQALRQCDGGRVQCIVMVRDDFWLSVSRFLRELEIRLLEGQNSALVDLFDLDHARRVLAAFGRAFGKLPEKPAETSKDQKEFLTQAVSGLAQEGKVISVRLALFAEMMKSKPWTPVSLKAVGGTEGVGVTFLEETFSAATAPPEHRYHQKAARADLKILLPETGSDIKGHMRSNAELLDASGYRSRPKDFADLIRILDNEIRLITPTDPEGAMGSGGCEPPDIAQQGGNTPRSPDRYYQLTHDYLVHSIREWLTRKQKETRGGRAELLLADRAAVWNARPENRQLPSLWQWFTLRALTQKKSWTPPQKKMMARAGKYQVVRGLTLSVVLAVATVAGLAIRGQVVEQRKATLAAGLVQRLLDADTAQVPGIVGEIAEYRLWTDPLLREENDKAADRSRQKLHLSLALLPVDATQVEWLYARMLAAEPPDLPVIRDSLAPHKNELLDRLWRVVEAPEKGKEQQRLQAACALASYDLPDNPPTAARWQRASKNVVKELLAAVQKNPSHYAMLLDQLRPVRTTLLLPLTEVYDSKEKAEADRPFATSILTDYAADQPNVLASLLINADEKQFATILAKLREHGDTALALLTEVIKKKLPAQLPASDAKRETLANQQANAAVALLRMDRPDKVWPLLKRNPPDDPRLRSYLIHRLSPLRADAGGIIKRLDEEPDITIRRALVLSLGQFSEEQLPADVRTSLFVRLKELYSSESDPGLHAAVEWLVRRWNKADWLKQLNDDWAKAEKERNQRIEAIRQLVKTDRDKTRPQWYVNGQGQTMVVIPGPVEFLMGSPLTEDGRDSFESQHKRRIGRTYALAAKPVTVREFRRFLRDKKLEKRFDSGGQAAAFMKRQSPDQDCPMILVDWYRAAEYCNWLSQKEGMPEDQWCYETNGRKLLQEKLRVIVNLLAPPHALATAANMSCLSLVLDHQPQVAALKKGYLGLQGYRLPTEAEMEYACRAGAVTSRYYGETDELLAEYGWYLNNSKDRTWPVGSKKPNDLGMFDMHGNVHNWCQESYKGDYSVSESGGRIEDEEDSALIVPAQIRVLRGGSFNNPSLGIRSACRFMLGPTVRFNDFGIRPARTIAP